MTPATPDVPHARAWSPRAVVRLVVVLIGLLVASVAAASWAWAAPAAPSFTEQPVSGGDSTPTWSWTSADPTTVRIACRLSHTPSGAVLHSAATCGTTYTPDLSGHPTGQYRMEITAYDAADAPSPTVASVWNYTGPAAPVITPQQGPRGSATSVGWAFTYEAGHTPVCELKRGSTVVQAFTGCTSPAKYTLTSGADGLYTFSVKTSNSPTSSSTYELDTTGPVLALSADTARGNSTSPTFTLGGGEAGATYACTLRSPGGATSAVSCAPGTVTPTLTTEQGTWTLSASAKDDLGNPGPVVSASYVLDTAGPAVTLTGPTGPSNDLTPTFTLGGGEAGATYHCTLRAPDGSTAPVSCSPGEVTPTLSGQQGTWTLLAYARDDLTNPGATVSWEYVLDTVGPAATLAGPSGGPASGPSNVLNPVFSWTGESGASVSCSLTSPTNVVTTLACGTGSITLSLPGSGGDGTWTVTVTVTDPAQNSTTRTATYLLDTSPPAASVAGPSGGASTGPSNVLNPVFSWTGESGASVSCSLTSPTNVVTTLACGTGSITLSLPASGGDGTWTVTVRVTDAAGNSTTRTATYLLDTSPPAASVAGPSGGAATGPSNVLNPVFTWTGESGATVVCSLTSPSGTVSALTCGTGSITLSLPPSGGDGTWTVTVRVTDAAGNSTTRTATYLLDTTPPAASLAGPAGPSNVLDPVFSWTAEAGSSVTCTLTSPSGAVTALDCGSGSLRLSLPSSGGDGAWTVTITVTDAGGTSTTRTVTYLLDTTAPVVGVTGPAGPSNRTDPSFSLTGEAGATYACTLTSPGGVTSVLACAAGTVTLDLSGAADGTWTLTVTATDATGNSTTRTATYLLDTTAPVVGVTGPAGPSNVTSPSFSLTGEAAATYACTLTSPGGVTSVLACAAGTVTLDLPASGGDGTWTVTVTVTDAAGNSTTRSASYLLDTTAPAAGVTGPAGPSAARQPTFTLTGETGGSFACVLTAPDGTSRAVACAAGTLVLDLSSGADGLWTLTVTVTDAAGSSASATATYLLDTAAPAAPLVTGPSGPSSSRTATFQLSAEAGSTLTCTLTSPDGDVRTVACADGALSLELAGPDGTWVLTVTATDAAGNTSGRTSASYLLDTEAPAMPVVTGGATLTSRDAVAVALDGGAATLTCTLVRPDGTSSVVPCSTGVLDLDLSGADGVYELRVVAVDDAGNTSEAVVWRVVRDTAAPAAPSVEEQGDGGWTVVTEDGAALTCTLTGPDGVETPLPCADGRAAVDPSLLAPGTWTLRVIATDAAGNASEVARRSFEVAAPPAPAPAPEPEPAPQPEPTPAPKPAPEPEPAPQPEPEPEPAAEAAEEPAPVELVREAVEAALPAATVLLLHTAVASEAMPRALARLGSRLELSTRWRATLRVLEGAVSVGGIPLLLLLLVVGFLAAQDRIDKNDPKLALAPVFSHQELPFRPVERFAL